LTTEGHAILQLLLHLLKVHELVLLRQIVPRHQIRVLNLHAVTDGPLASVVDLTPFDRFAADEVAGCA